LGFNGSILGEKIACKWVLFLQVGFRRKAKIREDSSKMEQKFGNNSELSGQEDEEEEEGEIGG